MKLWRVVGGSLDQFFPSKAEAAGYRDRVLSDYPDAEVVPITIPAGRNGLCRFLNDWAGIA